MAGCDCFYSHDLYYTGLYQGFCDSNKTYAGCQDVYPTGAVNLNWIGGSVICT